MEWGSTRLVQFAATVPVRAEHETEHLPSPRPDRPVGRTFEHLSSASCIRRKLNSATYLCEVPPQRIHGEVAFSSMPRWHSLQNLVVRYLMVPLVVLWPVMCCCWSKQIGCGSQLESSASPLAQHERGGCHEQETPADHSSDERGGCHDDAGGPCHDNGSDGCGCVKSQTTLADAGPSTAHVDPPLVLAWLPASFESMSAAGEPSGWSLRIDRPPPVPRLRLSVLRI